MDAKNMKTALTIAGSDSSGGAGIQADIKTMITNGVYAMSAITALTAQNTTGVSGIFDVTPEFLAAQLDAVFTDIFPDAVKIGMVSSPALIEVISERLRFYQAKHIVVDPVLVATSGSALASGGVPDLMKKLLFPLAEVITPNIPEGEVLSGIKIQSESDMERAAKEIGDSCGCAVLLKGGHSINDANDLLYHNGTFTWFTGKRIDNPNTHGTGHRIGARKGAFPSGCHFLRKRVYCGRTREHDGSRPRLGTAEPRLPDLILKIKENNRWNAITQHRWTPHAAAL